MRSILLLLAAFLFAPAQLHATGNPPILAAGSLGIVLSRGLVTYPIRKGVWQTKVAPSLVSQKDSREGVEVDLSGAGFGAAATYGLSDHWGLNFIAGYVKITGDRSLSTDYEQGDRDGVNPAFNYSTPKLNGTSNGGGSGWRVDDHG